MKPSKIKFPSASSMAKKEIQKKKKKPDKNESVRMMGYMARRGPDATL